MEEGDEKKFVCKFCYKTFPSGKSLGGHIRIHSTENSAGRYNGNKKKRMVDQREKQQQQEFRCRKCSEGFVSSKALSDHMAFHSEGEKMLMDSQSDTESETSSTPTRKRSKRVMAQKHKQQHFCRECGKEVVSSNVLSVHMACHSEGKKMVMDSQSDTARKISKLVMRIFSSESFSDGSLSFLSEIDQEIQEAACNLVIMKHNLVRNSLDESSDNNSVTVETMLSAGEDLEISNVKNQVLETDKDVDDDQLRSADDNGGILCDSDSSDSEYFMNGPKKSDSFNSVEGYGSRINSSMNRFKNSDGRRSKYELSKSPMVKKEGGEKKKSKGYKCPICFKVFKSGQALGGHKRSHSIGQWNQEHNQVSEMRNQIDLDVPALDNQFDLNVSASDNDE